MGNKFIIWFDILIIEYIFEGNKISMLKDFFVI